MRILTKQQFQLIAGEQYSKDSYFNPVLDADGDRVISEEEAEQCTNEDFKFVKDLPFKEWKPVIISTFTK